MIEVLKLTFPPLLEIMKCIILEISNLQDKKNTTIKTKISQLYHKKKGLQVLEQIG